MSRFKDVWKYRTITEVVQRLGKIDEDTRHLAIGAGIVLGSKNAYDKQPNYWINQIRDQAEETGLIAEKIEQLAGNKKIPKKTLKEIASLQGEPEKLPWSRPYHIFREKQPYDVENLKLIGEHIEKRFLGKNNQKGFKRFRKKLGRKTRGLEYEVCKGSRLMEEKGLLTRYLIDYFGRRY